MDIKNPERLEQLKQLLPGLRSRNLCLAYDIDADGMSSGYLIKRAFEKMGLGFRLELTDIARMNLFSEENRKKILDEGIDYVVATDIAFAALGLLPAKDILSKKGVKFLVFDHHEYNPSMQSSDFLLIHPIDMFGDEHSTMCASKLVYDILGQFVPLSDYEWAKGVGMIGDMNFIKYADELQAIMAKYEGKKQEIKSAQDYYKTRIGNITQLVNFAMATGNTSSVKEMFKAYSESGTINSLEKKLATMDVAGIRKEIEFYSANFEELSDKKEGIYLLEIKSQYKLGSMVSTIISQTMPDHTFIVYEKLKNNRYIISARRQDNIYSMRDLLKMSINGMNDANGGGHVPAAGASIMAEDWETFKSNLIKYHEKSRVI